MVNFPGVTRYQPTFMPWAPSGSMNPGSPTMIPSGQRPPTQSCPFPWLLPAPNSASKGTPGGGSNEVGRVIGQRAESAMVTGPPVVVGPVISGDAADPAGGA